MTLDLDCPDIAALEDETLSKILTQYRESPNLQRLIKSYNRQVSDVMLAICSMPYYFDLDHAVGDQLTILGKELGFTRNHCVCATQPVFGFDCSGFPSAYTLGGFCDDSVTWLDCGPTGIAELSINDDELYRKFLKVRRYQMLSLYDLDSLTEAIQTLWGDTARVLDAGQRRVVIAPGRDLTASEVNVLQLYPRVLPVAIGVRIRFHFGSTLKVFGFEDGWGGFCEPYLDDAFFDIGDGVALMISDTVALLTGTLTIDADWMCEIDVHPYDCPDGGAISEGELDVPTTPVAPFNLTLPFISGSPAVGQALQVDPGTWTGTPPPSFSYQWQADVGGNNVFANISGANGALYLLTAAELGDKVRVIVTATNTVSGISANTGAAGPVTATPAPTTNHYLGF